MGSADITLSHLHPCRPRPIGMMALALVAAMGVGTSPGQSIDQRLAAAIEAADRDDPHWRIGDLMARRRDVAPEENSAVIVGKALALIPENWPSDTTPPPGRPKPPPSEVERAYNLLSELPDSARLDEAAADALRKDLRVHADAAQLARTVADYVRGRHELELGPALIDTLLPETRAARTAARLLAADAEIRARDGNLDGALDSCRAILGVARSIGDEPFLVSQLVRIAIDRLAAKTARRVLAQGEPTDKALVRLQAAMLDESSWPLLVDAMKGERAILFELTRRIGNGEVPLSALTDEQEFDPTAPRSKAKPWDKALLDNQLATGLEWMNEAVSIARKPPAERPARWKAWDAEINRTRKNWIVRSGVLIPILMTTTLSSSDRSLSRGQTEMRATAILLAAERHRSKVGSWPASIEAIDKEFLPEPPTDEFTGEPFRMEYRDGRLLVYSIGINRKDEHGEFDERRWSGPGPDDTGGSLWDVSLRKQSPAP